MRKNLNPKKVVEEIDSLLAELATAEKRKEDFEGLHKRCLQLCKIIFQTRKEYKNIDEPYPVSVTLVLDDAFGGNTQLPSPEYRHKQRVVLVEKVRQVLLDARGVYALKLKLLEQ